MRKGRVTEAGGGTCDYDFTGMRTMRKPREIHGFRLVSSSGIRSRSLWTAASGGGGGDTCPPGFLATGSQLSVDNVGQRGGGCLGRGRLEKGTGMAVGALLFVAEFVVVCAKSAATVCARIGLFTWKT